MLWQLYKSTGEVRTDYGSFIEKWLEQNPKYSYRFLGNENLDDVVHAYASDSFYALFRNVTLLAQR
jgi:mannosyltransferase OCH1-like enzyme